jgi:hypothetical protein
VTSTVKRPIVTVCTPTFQGPRTPGSLGTEKSELPHPVVAFVPEASFGALGDGPGDDASPDAATPESLSGIPGPEPELAAEPDPVPAEPDVAPDAPEELLPPSLPPLGVEAPVSAGLELHPAAATNDESRTDLKAQSLIVTTLPSGPLASLHRLRKYLHRATRAALHVGQKWTSFGTTCEIPRC